MLNHSPSSGPLSGPPHSRASGRAWVPQSPHLLVWPGNLIGDSSCLQSLLAGPLNSHPLTVLSSCLHLALQLKCKNHSWAPAKGAWVPSKTSHTVARGRGWWSCWTAEEGVSSSRCLASCAPQRSHSLASISPLCNGQDSIGEQMLRVERR
jgi:hypothetical protein